MMPPIVLASTSIYRKELLSRLGVNFICEKPTCDEEFEKENLLALRKTPKEIAAALALAKAHSVLTKMSQSVIIASDQLISFQDKILGKPHTKDEAHLQLRSLAGKTHELITAVVILTPQQIYTINHISKMSVKDLTDTEITNYIAADNPIDCAGSYKIEKSGIGLFSNVETSDFTAIQGLPLIWVSTKLKEIGYELFSQNK